MTKTKGILLAAFCLVFAAGTSLGLFINRPAAPATPSRGPSELAKELDLTPEQQEQMQTIWSNAMRDSHRDQWRTLSQERDKKMQSLLAQLTDEQRVQYDGIQQEHSRKSQELSQALSQEREQKVLAVLSADQRAAYEATQKYYAGKFDELSQEQRKANDEAVRLTRQILTPVQAAKYDKMLQDRGHGMRGRGFRYRGSSSASRPATAVSETSSRSAE